MRVLIGLKVDKNDAVQICTFSKKRINRATGHMYAVYASCGSIEPIRVHLDYYHELEAKYGSVSDDIIIELLESGEFYDDDN